MVEPPGVRHLRALFDRRAGRPAAEPLRPGGAQAVAAESEPRARASDEARRLLLGDRHGPASEGCACCGELAARALSVTNARGRHLLVGYCDACAEHVAASDTRRVSSLFAGALLGGSLAAGLPLALPWMSFGATAACAFAGTLLVPLAARALERPAPGHAAAGHAVFFRGASGLVCRRAAWAEELGARLGTAVLPDHGRSPWFGTAWLLGLVAAFAAAMLHRFHHPPLRVLNLGEQTLEVVVDGRLLGRVQPSSAESPGAGLELRLPSGRRVLELAELDGHPLARDSVRLLSGKHHLYAPLGPEHCFWLEARSYGRDTSGDRITPLAPNSRFWIIPDDVRGWFSPNPAPGSDERVTGGTSVALRQGPCAEAPPGVRPPDMR